MIQNDKFPKNLQRTGKQQKKSSSRHALGFAGHVKIKNVFIKRYLKLVPRSMPLNMNFEAVMKTI